MKYYILDDSEIDLYGMARCYDGVATFACHTEAIVARPVSFPCVVASGFLDFLLQLVGKFVEFFLLQNNAF